MLAIFAIALLKTRDSIIPFGIHSHPAIQLGRIIFEREWDLIIILDTFRVDALQNQVDELMGHNIEKMRSVGSNSAEWKLNTFTERYSDKIEKSAFVSGEHLVTPHF